MRSRFIENAKNSGSCKFRKLDNIGLSINFLLYEGDYGRMDRDGIRMPQPRSQSPRKTYQPHATSAVDEVADRLSRSLSDLCLMLLTFQRVFRYLNAPTSSQSAYCRPVTAYYTNQNRSTTPHPSNMDAPRPHHTVHTAYLTIIIALCPPPHSHDFWCYPGRNRSHLYDRLLTVGQHR